MIQRYRKSTGFTLITTLFLLVVVSSLGAYLVNMSITQHTSSMLAVKAQRARLAALSGLEWVAYRIANIANSCPSSSTSLVIEGFNVTLTGCAATVVIEGVDTYTLFDITVTAQSGTYGDSDYVNLAVRANLKG